jgi:hypothetical protein
VKIRRPKWWWLRKADLEKGHEVGAGFATARLEEELPAMNNRPLTVAQLLEFHLEPVDYEALVGDMTRSGTLMLKPGFDTFVATVCLTHWCRNARKS